MIEGAIPCGAYRSTPFARWQGSLAHLNSLKFAARVAKDALRRRAIDPAAFDHSVLGLTVPQRRSFYGLTWRRTPHRQLWLVAGVGPSARADQPAWRDRTDRGTRAGCRR